MGQRGKLKCITSWRSMSTLCGILVGSYALLDVGVSATPLNDPHFTDRIHSDQTESLARSTHATNRSSCMILEDEADELTKRLNGFLSIFGEVTRLVVGGSLFLNKSSSFALNCTFGISDLETSVWLIHKRIWLAASCQYSNAEYEQAMDEVAEEAKNMQETLASVHVILGNGTVIHDYYNSAVTKVRDTFEQAVEKMRNDKATGRCNSSALNGMTTKFEGALEEIKAQKIDIAKVQEDMRQVLRAINLQKQLVFLALKAIQENSSSLDAALLSFSKNQLSEVISPLANSNAVNTTRVHELSSSKPQFTGLTSTMNPLTELQSYLSSGFEFLSGRLVNLENEYYRGEYLYLARNPTDRNASVAHDGAIAVVGKNELRQSAWQWEFVPVPEEGSSIFYLRNKLNEHKAMPSKDTRLGKHNYVYIEYASSPGGDHSTQFVVSMSPFDDKYYHPRSKPTPDARLNWRKIYMGSSPNSNGTKWIVTFAQTDSDAMNSKLTSVHRLNQAPFSQLNSSTPYPPTALQSYLSSGFEGLIGRFVNIESWYDKGNYLYIINEELRNGRILGNSAILGVDEEELRENARLIWDFVPLPGNHSSRFYLRNKLNEHEPMQSVEDSSGERNSFVSIETVPSPEDPIQLVIYIKNLEDEYYAPTNLAAFILTRKSGKVEAPTIRTTHRPYPWIVTFAS